MLPFEILDEERPAQSVSPRSRGRNRLDFEEPRRAIDPKDLLANARDLVSRGLLANMPRAVIFTVRQFVPSGEHDDASHFSDCVNDLVERITIAGEQQAPIVALTSQERFQPILRQLMRELRNAESHGHTAEFKASLGEWLAGVAESSTDSARFLEHAKQLDRRGHTDAALDLVYDQIDEMLLSGRFSEVDGLLATVSVTDMSLDLLLALLTATLPAKKRLAKRGGFFASVEQTLRQRAELEDGLLVGLD